MSIPVTLISGYLGAGKTTLVNALLRGADGRRLAVLVNDFGELPIDADLIEAREGNLISISGGCVCCSFGSDLIAALMDLRTKTAAIDHLLIETSGVALPGSIAQSLVLVDGLAVDGIIALADAETVTDRAKDRYVGDTVIRQIAAADLIILNKTDLVGQAQLDAARNWLAEINPQASVVPARNADVPSDIILGRRDELPPRSTRRAEPLRHRTADYATASFELEGYGDAQALARALAAPELGLLRAKGFLQGSNGAFVTLQLVGRRFSIEPIAQRIQGRGRLVCIGLADTIDRRAILAAIEAASFRPTI